MKMITTKDRGKLKSIINGVLFQSPDIKEMLLGDVAGRTTEDLAMDFRKYVKSHLFVDGILSDTKTYIFFDVVCPEIHAHTKELTIVMYAVCHRDILDTCICDGYYGNRVDILSQMIEDAMLDEKNINKFGIGELALGSVDILNMKDYYGLSLPFTVSNFR